MAEFDIEGVVRALHEARADWRATHRRSREPGGRELPSRTALAAILEQLQGALFPMRLGPPELRHDGEDFYVGYTLETALQALLEQARLEVSHALRHDEKVTPADVQGRAESAVRAFAAQLPQIRRLLDSDVQAAFQGDPAARSVDEVLLCRSGKRSAQAAEAAAKAGFRHVFNVLEGFEGELDARQQRGHADGWRFHGLPWVQD